MKMKWLCVFCFLVACSAQSLFAQEWTPRTEKIIDKNIHKLWKKQTIRRVPLDTGLSLESKIFFDGNKLFELRSDTQTEGYLILRRALGCKIGGCGVGNYNSSQVCHADGGAYEVFDYALFLGTDLTVKKVVVTDYPGDYGYEITAPGWLNQFIGYAGGDLRYGADVDAISGATISANSITWDLVETWKMFKKLLEAKHLFSSDAGR
ncbi:MAG: hypothetical protein D6714_10920 [Bacteroidetes bacterium]|nr:MAG: hypothetical protein D6714_10920 [Bacteroidota bacterium]